MSGSGTAASIRIEMNQAAHLADFVRLNEQWITEHFALEAPDLALAADPGAVARSGGCVFSLTEAGQVVGVCALFVDRPGRLQLARMAVDPSARGRGHGDALIERALAEACAMGMRSVVLFSNTRLEAAIALYRKHGFAVIATGPHTIYARCDIVMERSL